MYTFDEKRRAVELFVQHDCSCMVVINELGYPCRDSLYKWYREYNGKVENSSTNRPKKITLLNCVWELVDPSVLGRHESRYREMEAEKHDGSSLWFSPPIAMALHILTLHICTWLVYAACINQPGTNMQSGTPRMHIVSERKRLPTHPDDFARSKKRILMPELCSARKGRP